MAPQIRARPGKTGLAAGSMVFTNELPVQILRVFRPELALWSEGKCDPGAQKGPHLLARFGAPKLAHCSGHFSPGQYVGALLSKFKLWILQTIGTLVGTFVTNRQKSVKIDEIGENH